MMTLETDIFLPAVTVLAIAGFSVGCLRMRARLHRERAADLKIAYHALEEFYASTHQVVSDPAVSDELKMILITIGQTISDRSMAKLVVDELSRDDVIEKRAAGDNDRLFAEAQILFKTRPALAETVSVAVKSSLVALFLRWPETAAKYKKLSAALTSDRAEMAVAKKASRFVKEHHNDHNNHNLPNNAVPA